MACGRIGLSFDYLYSLTSRQFSNIQDGWNANQELQTKTSWEQTRMLYDAVIRPHLKDKNKSARDLLPFPWDDNSMNDEELEINNSEELSFEDMEARWKEIDKMVSEEDCGT
ncbi:hypothetical protein [Myroides marinus]|uniref:hypothetical protein n=1 Tax=Myroides marinus TaxID=703342 RepID=UPI002578B6E8|nr:hypothetical protein [Myroides marinus]